MSTDRAAVELQLKHFDLVDAYVAAKAIDRDSDECKAAKAALNEHRTYWRQIRDALKVPVTPGSATAFPAPVGLTAPPQEV